MSTTIEREPSLNGAMRPAERPAPPRKVDPPKMRRRPGLLALGVALAALGSLASVYLVNALGDTTSVLAIARPVAQGTVLQLEDLVAADTTRDPALKTIPVERSREYIGKHAAVALTPGQLLTPDSVTDQLLPLKGQAVVGLALKPAQMPREPLQPGDKVRIVDIPADSSKTEDSTSSPVTLDAEVVSSGTVGDTGDTVVDVTVPSNLAPGLAARAASGFVAVVLESRAR